MLESNDFLLCGFLPEMSISCVCVCVVGFSSLGGVFKIPVTTWMAHSYSIH